MNIGQEVVLSWTGSGSQDGQEVGLRVLVAICLHQQHQVQQLCVSRAQPPDVQHGLH